MFRVKRLTVAGAASCLLLGGCTTNAFDDIEGPEPVLPSQVLALGTELHTLRPLGEHGDITYVAARSGRDSNCLVMYRTGDPSKPIAGCSEGGWVNVGGEDVGEATFYSEGVNKQDSELNGEQVSEWLVINSPA